MPDTTTTPIDLALASLKQQNDQMQQLLLTIKLQTDANTNSIKSIGDAFNDLAARVLGLENQVNKPPPSVDNTASATNDANGFFALQRQQTQDGTRQADALSTIANVAKDWGPLAMQLLKALLTKNPYVGITEALIEGGMKILDNYKNNGASSTNTTVINQSPIQSSDVARLLNAIESIATSSSHIPQPLADTVTAISAISKAIDDSVGGIGGDLNRSLPIRDIVTALFTIAQAMPNIGDKIGGIGADIAKALPLVKSLAPLAELQALAAQALARAYDCDCKLLLAVLEKLARNTDGIIKYHEITGKK